MDVRSNSMALLLVSASCFLAAGSLQMLAWLFLADALKPQPGKSPTELGKLNFMCKWSTAKLTVCLMRNPVALPVASGSPSCVCVLQTMASAWVQASSSPS